MSFFANASNFSVHNTRFQNVYIHPNGTVVTNEPVPFMPTVLEASRLRTTKRTQILMTSRIFRGPPPVYNSFTLSRPHGNRFLRFVSPSSRHARRKNSTQYSQVHEVTQSGSVSPSDPEPDSDSDVAAPATAGSSNASLPGSGDDLRPLDPVRTTQASEVVTIIRKHPDVSLSCKTSDSEAAASTKEDDSCAKSHCDDIVEPESDPEILCDETHDTQVTGTHSEPQRVGESVPMSNFTLDGPIFCNRSGTGGDEMLIGDWELIDD
ncbi:hypothetical protein BDP27DRAFT_1406865 [Rhodocollybia butyracea]|uniref:Uncharacterized protein n=1 Tax=Rhodocollybia butyracea TaxID=206335 RepID=A0A9P5P8T3_9AGAR|nr:hypothetical protein BDP27DRAFT_1406865 [Rhodocollybia butyracea]